MPDLHLTITSLSGATPSSASAPLGAAAGATAGAAASDAPDADAHPGRDAFAALLAGSIGKAAAAQAALPAADPKAPAGVQDPRGEAQQLRAQTGADVPALPTRSATRDAAQDAAKDASKNDPAGDPTSAQPPSAADPAMQLLVNLGLLPPPAPPAQTAPAAIAAAGGRSLPGASADSRAPVVSALREAPATGGAAPAAAGTASGEQAGRRGAEDGRDEQRVLHGFAAALQAQAPAQKAASAVSLDPAITAAAAAPLPGASAPAGDAYASGALPGLQPAAPAAPVQVALPATLGTPAWREEFASGVTLLATHRITSAELRVQPAELGPVQVSIRMDGGEASISCAAQHAATRDALDAALPRLREMLEASGISVGNASVGPQFSGNGAPHSQPQAPFQPQGRAGTLPDAPADTLPAAPARAALRLDQLVDTFA